MRNNKNEIKKYISKKTFARMIFIMMFLSCFLLFMFLGEKGIFLLAINMVNKLIQANYFQFIISVSIGIIGFILTLISIFGVGSSNVILMMPENKIIQYINTILDLFILALSIIFLTITLDYFISIEDGFILNHKPILSYIYIWLLLLLILQTGYLALLTVLMFSINILSLKEEEKRKDKLEEKRNEVIADIRKNLNDIKEKIEVDETRKY